MCWNHKVYLLLSVAKSHPTLCGPMDCSTPGSSVLRDLPEFAQTHVHRVGDAIQPSHPLLPPSPFAFSLSQHQGSLQWVSYLTFQVPMLTASDSTLTPRHIHNSASFPLWPCRFIVSRVISLFFSSKILDTLWPGGPIFQGHTFCLFILSLGFSRQEYWSVLPY